MLADVMKLSAIKEKAIFLDRRLRQVICLQKIHLI